jgi:hypothetical protein
MHRFMIGLLVGLAIGVAGALLFVTLRPSRSWEEKSVRAQAEGLGCTLTHGLNVTCVRVVRLSKAGGGTWIAMYGEQRRVCFLLHPATVPPHRQAC